MKCGSGLGTLRSLGGKYEHNLSGKGRELHLAETHSVLVTGEVQVTSRSWGLFKRQHGKTAGNLFVLLGLLSFHGKGSRRMRTLAPGQDCWNR